MRRLCSLLLGFLLSCDVNADPQTSKDAGKSDVEVHQTYLVPDYLIHWKPVPVSRRILIVGDSEACAVGSYARSIDKELQEAAGLPVDFIDVECKVSTTVPYWGAMGNLQAALGRHPKPDTVLIFLGTNHYWNEKDTPDVSPILDLLTAFDIKCVWAGNTAVHGRHWAINHLLRDAVTPTCSYFDTEAANIPLADGIHPTGAGAIKWLKAIWPMIPPKYEEHK